MKIEIKGKGIVSALGNGVEETLDALRSLRSGIGFPHHLKTSHTDLPVGEVHYSDDELKSMFGMNADEVMSRTALMGAVAIREALNDAGMDVETIKGQRVTLISGTTVGGMDVLERLFRDFDSSDEMLHYVTQYDCGSSTMQMAEILGLDCETCTISTACSSAVNSIIVGCEMLRAGETDIVIAGGAESLSLFHLNGFNSLMILDKEHCRPFDANRAGLNLGEGAAFVVLTPAAASAASAASMYVSGYANRCDAFHQTASSENGEGAYLCMTDALQMANLQPSDIDYVNAHGTATPNNDQSESIALQRVFGELLNTADATGWQVMVSSTKGFTGHATSAAGSIETVISLLALQHQFVPSNIGWDTKIPDGVTPCMGQEATLHHVMCNSFGFGGNDSAIIVSNVAVEPDAATAVKPVECIVASDVIVDDMEQLKELKEFIPVMASRRMGKLMKGAMLSSLRALRNAGVECPDAIITATAYGMLENSERMLVELSEQGEGNSSPTLFMQSTHNTIGSAIAIHTQCHGYNITYCQGAQSMEWAMRDARRLIETGKAKTVLVGCYDESTSRFGEYMKRLGMSVPQEVSCRSIVLKAK